ncbi:hypothetical protein ACFO1B_15260 [Dactylosporangium siamense]|uniref:Uncharacterized protein n=1 Tax=Dactylosporangium siamense TaxID=685454 RepID=A0A919PJP4_9ACTN|nr:hypothetical protein [Dactylosporangium siamense]GIG45194.1 hypothetical protein Dsi01nite_032350 [Dactylosporangium siamense]
MAVVFNLILHVLLIGSMAAFVIAIVADALADPDRRERVLRIAALAAGALVVLGAQSAGASYALFIVDALAGARGPSTAAAVGAAVVPALAGAALGFFLVRTYKRSTRIGARVLGFVGMLSATAFVGIYAEATHTRGVMLGAAALPNVSFVVGVILTIVFAFDPDLPVGQGRMSQLRRLFGGSGGSGGSTGSGGGGAPGPRPGAPRGDWMPPPAQARRDPFDN